MNKENNTSNKGKILGLTAMVMVLIIGVAGTTFALVSTSLNSSVTVNTANLGVAYTGSFSSSGVSLVPIKDSAATTSNKTNAINLTFTAAPQTNNSGKTMIHKIRLKNLNISSNILNNATYRSYLKYKLVNTTQNKTYTGTFSSVTTSAATMDLMTEYLDLTASNSYTLTIWITEACTASNISSCTSSKDQTGMMGGSISGTVEAIVATR